VLKVHHLEMSRSTRILWMLEELGLDYELVEHKRNPKTFQAEPTLRAVHPLGKSPILTDGDTVVAESGAILTYLVEKTGQLAPEPGTEAWRRYVYYLHYPEGSLMPFLTMTLVFHKVATSPAPFFLRPVLKGVRDKVSDAFLRPNLERHIAFLEAELGDREFWAGDALTAADIQMSYPVLALVDRSGGLAEMPNLERWIRTIEQRPAYQRALDKGGAPLPS